jgi:uncharacterized cupredoxin-like copper-binding protein
VRFARLALLAGIAVFAAACSGGTSAPTSPAPSAPALASPTATRFAVRLTDTLRMEPASMTVPAGVPVTFVVTNAGAIDHEFYLGDEEAQAEHEKEMMSSGGMKHDEPEGIAVAPGQTKELTFSFTKPGAFLAGCHVTGHYGGGMKAEITVAE